MPENKSVKKLGPVIVRAAVKNGSYNADANTVKVVFATEEKVYVRHWDGDYYQVLVCSADAIRAERLNNGAVHLIDTHDDSTAESIYGRVVAWGIEQESGLNQCWADIALSVNPDNAGIVADIKAGIISAVSVKARPWAAMQMPQNAGDTLPVVRVTSWEPMEISVCAVPADYSAVIKRNDQSDDFTIDITNSNNLNSSDMPDNKGTQDPQQPAEPIVRNVQEPAPQPVQPPAQQPAEPIVRNVQEPGQQPVNIAADILRRCENAGLDLKFATEVVATPGITIERANSMIVDEIARKHQENNPSIRGGGNAKVTGTDEKDITRTAIQDAIIHRADPSAVQLNDKSRDYRNMSLLDIARNCLIVGGMNYNTAIALGKEETIKRAISTTDYADLLTSTVARQLRKYYSVAPSDWKKLGTRTTVSDFRAKTGLAVDGKVTFDEMAEDSEYKSASIISTEKATIAVKTYGKMIGITRKAIINDDLDAFSKIPKIFAQGAANLQADLFWAMLTNPATKTPDGTALFHAATHKNLVSSGTAMSETTINDGIVAIAKQTSLAGEVLNLSPKYLIVPLEKVMAAKKLIAGVTATATGDVNTLQGALEIVTDARLSVASSTAWYLAVDPAMVEGLMYAYLDGEQELYTESQTNFHTDSVETKARLEFGVACWDYRGLYKNVGA